MTSINTNLGAYSAQQNLKTANALTLASISRLSSGNRIDKAATDVAGLSVGTILQTNVSTLRKGLENASQASTLLQVADGGLKNITNILQRQKALSVAATAGTLSAAERGYLNQEFQNLTTEIDRLVDNTKFNSVKLLDGSLSKQVALTTDTFWDSQNGVTAVADTPIATYTANAAAGDKITVNGVVVELVANTTDANSADAKGKVIIGATQTVTAQNVAAFLNSSNDARLRGAYFTSAGAIVAVEIATGLQDGAVQYITTAEVVDAAAGVTVANVTSAAAESEDGLGVSRTFAIGDITGTTLINKATAATDSGRGIDVANVEGNESFLGKIGGKNIGQFQVSYVSTDVVTVSLQVGDYTYTSAASADIGGNAAAVNLTLTNTREGAFDDSFIISFADNVFANNALDSQQDADELAGRLDAALADVTFVQNRDVKSFQPAGNKVLVNGAEVANFTDSSVNLVSDDFDDVNFQSVKITAPGTGQTDAVIEVVISGETYRSFSGIGSRIEDNTIIYLQNVDNPNRSLQIVTSTGDIAGASNVGIALDLSTQEYADAIASALETAFGVGSGKASLNFQIGSASSDAIGVEVTNASTETLFGGIDLNILTVDDANTASDTLDEAIATVTSLRANIGALQSRFDYASANLETSIQNIDAARGSFLDANISEEATAFAQAQVKLQASISVLAQANQLPQNLLKLIG